MDARPWCDLEDSVPMDVRSAANCGELGVLLEAVPDLAPRRRGEDVCGGWTALMYACSRQSSAAVDALLQLGADVDARDRRGQTALMQASKLGDVDVVRKLLAAVSRRPRPAPVTAERDAMFETVAGGGDADAGPRGPERREPGRRLGAVADSGGVAAPQVTTPDPSERRSVREPEF